MCMHFSVCLPSVYVYCDACRVNTFENADNVSNGMQSTQMFRLFY